MACAAALIAMSGAAPGAMTSQASTQPSNQPSTVGRPETQQAATSTAPASSEPAAGGDPRGWRIMIAPLLWIAGVDGTSTMGSIESDFDAPIDEVVANLDFGFMLHAEAGNGPLSLLFDGITVHVDAEGDGRLVGDIDAEVEVGMIDLGLGYRVVDVPFGKPPPGRRPGPGLGLDLLGGLRYSHIGLEIDTDNLGSRERNADLIDPYVGARADLRLNRWLALGAKGTVGGFGVGSDLAWTATGTADFRFTPGFSVFVGYHVMDYEFDDLGSGENFDLDLQLSGPVVGAALRF